MSKKRILIIADKHCGHRTGLTPPAWQEKLVKDGSSTKHNKWAILQRELWQKYVNLLSKHAPYDLAIDMGDQIDGNGWRSGGTELITTDRDEQVNMAVECCDTVRLYANKGFKWYGVFGTAYHTGEQEDWENRVAKDAGFEKIGSHEWLDVNGCIIDCKHHCGSSSVPHGRFTQPAKEKLWNVLWAERGLVPSANIILRAHVHYATYCGSPGWVAMTLPALQGMGSRYGSRRCSGTVDWGITVIDVESNGSFDWIMESSQISAQICKAIKV